MTDFLENKKKMRLHFENIFEYFKRRRHYGIVHTEDKQQCCHPTFASLAYYSTF